MMAGIRKAALLCAVLTAFVSLDGCRALVKAEEHEAEIGAGAGAGPGTGAGTDGGGLEGLQVLYGVGGGKTDLLAGKFTGGEFVYSVVPSPFHPDAKITVIATALDSGARVSITVGSGGATEGMATAIRENIASPNREGAPSVPITVRVEGYRASYTVSVQAPQSHEMNNYNLASLMVSTASTGSLVTFDRTQNRYQVELTSENIGAGVLKVEAVTASDVAKAKILDGGVDYATPLNGSSVTAQITQPPPGASKTFAVQAVSYSGQQSERYEVTVIGRNDRYAGTLTNNSGKAFTEVEITGFDGSGYVHQMAVAPVSGTQNFTFNAILAPTERPVRFEVVLRTETVVYAPITVAANASATTMELSVGSDDLFIPIYSAADLKQKIHGRANYCLMNDIDLSTVRPWMPIDYYDGTFDGKGYKITNLRLPVDNDNAGLFGQVTAVAISNLTVVVDNGANSPLMPSRGGSYGVLAGYADPKGGSGGPNITLTNVVVAGSLYFKEIPAETNFKIGGLLGSVYDTNNSIKYCASEVDITVNTSNAGGTVRIGGIANFLEAVTNADFCYAAGNILCNDSSSAGRTWVVGGIAGSWDPSSRGRIRNTYVSGAVECQSNGSVSAGGIVGGNDSTALEIKNCAVLGDRVLAISTDAGSTAKRISSAGNIDNCFALNTMSVGTSKSAGTVSGGGQNGVNKTIGDFKQQTTWTNTAASGGLNWRPTIDFPREWDFSRLGSSVWPTLK